jgi:starch synthase
VSFNDGYDEALAHAIFAGSDLTVVPSRYEPCGLTQMYGLRYGAVPVVRRVGGLADTVHEAMSDDDASSNGFVFDAVSSATLQAALARAIECYRQPTRWLALMRRGMELDHSWAGPAARYMALYARLIQPMQRAAEVPVKVLLPNAKDVQ